MEGGGRYENGAKAILHAKPSDGFRFLSWIGAPALDVSDLATILVNSDLNLTARFVRTFELAIRVLPSGSGIARGSDVYKEGEIFIDESGVASVIGWMMKQRRSLRCCSS